MGLFPSFFGLVALRVLPGRRVTRFPFFLHGSFSVFLIHFLMLPWTTITIRSQRWSSLLALRTPFLKVRELSFPPSVIPPPLSV